VPQQPHVTVGNVEHDLTPCHPPDDAPVQPVLDCSYPNAKKRRANPALFVSASLGLPSASALSLVFMPSTEGIIGPFRMASGISQVATANAKDQRKCLLYKMLRIG
jgi:hypothetical protein